MRLARLGYGLGLAWERLMDRTEPAAPWGA